MTNNPTIDGVSRELRELLERVVGKPTGKPNWDALDEGRIAAAEELRALLDAPAVERQEPVPVVDGEQWWAETPDGDAAIVTRVGALTEWQRGRDSMRDERDSAISELAALQSTIAQLQARVQELESGSDAVAWMVEVDGMTLHHRAPMDNPRAKNTPLFTAPPAPVAFVLPERKPRVTSAEEPDSHVRMLEQIERNGWNACLDATAALNGERK